MSSLSVKLKAGSEKQYTSLCASCLQPFASGLKGLKPPASSLKLKRLIFAATNEAENH
jgi:hypothetical protein